MSAKTIDHEFFWSIIIGLAGCSVAALVADYLFLATPPSQWWLHPAPILEFLVIFGLGYLYSRVMSAFWRVVSIGAIGIGLIAEAAVNRPALGDGFVLGFSLAVLGAWLAGNALGACHNHERKEVIGSDN